MRSPFALLLAAATALAALAALPGASAAEYPVVYCWDGIAGSECGVDTGNCDARTGYNYVADFTYTEAECEQTPVGPCFVGTITYDPLRADCGPVKA